MINIFCLVGGLILSLVTSYFCDALTLSRIYIPIILFFAYVIALMVLFAVALYITSLLLPKKRPKKVGKFSYFVVQIVVRWICQMSNIKVHINGGEKIEKGKQYLLVCNHRSMFDPIIQLVYFKRCKPIMVSKPENFKIPIAGPFIRNAGFLDIDRENNREALKTIIRAIDSIKTQGVSVGICPEGTRNLKSRDLLPLKAGAFKIATKAKVPVVVMTLEGTEKIHKNFPFKRTHIYIDVLKVYNYSDYENLTTQELCDDVAKTMQDNINKYTVGNNNEKK